MVTVLRLSAQTVLLVEGFEGNFPQDNGWAVGGTKATWGKVLNGFGRTNAPIGTAFAYCAAVGNAGTTTSPVYPNYMDGYMEKTLDLTPYSAATLGFAYLIPTIGGCDLSGCDSFRVLIDATNLVFEQHSGVPLWQPVTVNLRNYTGGRHTLRFEFVSAFDIANYVGAYLDEIVVIGQPTLLTNVLVNKRTEDANPYDTQNEPSMVLGAGGTVLVAFNDSGSLRNSTNKFTGWAVSTNGGMSCQDMGTLPSEPYGDGGDPVLARDSKTGVIYLATIIITNSPTGSGQEASPGPVIQLFRSSDNGVSFKAPGNAAPGFVAGDRLDKPWLAVDNFVGDGQGNAYLAFRDFPSSSTGTQQQGIYLTRSLDGGVTWGPAPGRLVGANGQGAFVVIGPRHEVYVFWLNYGVGARIQVSKSFDHGVTFGGITTVANISSTALKGDLGLNTRTDSFPRAAVNPVTGDLYVVYNDKGVLAGDLGDIFFTRSSDGATTWTKPQRVNQDFSLRSQWFPCLCASPDGHNLFIGWYDRRLEAWNGTNDQQTAYGIFATVNGTNVLFGMDFSIGDTLFQLPPAGSDPSVTTSLGDYIEAAADDQNVYFAWTDARSGDSDIRLVKIPIPDRFGKFALEGAAAVLNLNTNPGRSYAIDRSTDLTSWTTLTNFVAGDFTFRFLDSSAAASSPRFYRASSH